MRNLLAALLVLLSSSALAQRVDTTDAPPYAGAALTATGYDISTATLFVAPNAGVQVAAPFSLAFGFANNGPAFPEVQQTIIDSRAGANTTGLGFFAIFCPSCNIGFPFDIGLGSAANYDCGPAGMACARDWDLFDNSWHHACYTVTSAGAKIYIDGIQRASSIVAVTTSNPQTKYLNLGQRNNVGNVPLGLRDMALWNRALKPSECALIHSRAANGKSLDAGSLAVGRVAYWKFDDCSGSGASLTCPDSQGTAHWISDQTPPTVVVTSPAAGPVSGSVSLQATCTDGIACGTIVWYMCTNAGANCLNVGSSATAPYTVTFSTVNIVDGSYQFKAVATNVAGVTGSGTVAVTTSNALAAANYFFDPVNGNDAWDCKAGQFVSGSNGPCRTQAKIQSSTYHGGDTIAIANTGAYVMTTNLLFLGASSGLGTQNVFPGPAQLTVTSYTPGGGGTCNVLPGGTTTGCAVFNLDPASAQTAGFQLANTSNITVQNIILTGGTTATSATAMASAGIYVRNSSSLAQSGWIIQNTKILDFDSDIQLATLGSGKINGFTIANNYIGGSSSSSTVKVDNGVDTQAGVGVSGATSLVQGNYFTNINGHPAGTAGYFHGCCGNGALFANSGVGNITHQFNVVNGFGGNLVDCGANFGMYVYLANHITYQYNEVYGGRRSGAGGCDTGGLDIDIGTSFSLTQYNYLHDNAGPGLAHFNENDGSNIANFNILRFNVVERSPNVTNGGGQIACYSIFGGVGQANLFYNNTCYNDTNNTNVSCWSFFADSTPGYVFANNICYFPNNTQTMGFANSPPGAPGVTFLNNDYFCANTGAGAGCTFRWAGNNYVGLAAFQAATGEEIGSVAVDPKLVSPGNQGALYVSGAPVVAPVPTDYKLQAGSPLLGVGLDLTVPPYNQTITTDIFGNSCPGAMGGTGYNIGADACGNP